MFHIFRGILRFILDKLLPTEHRRISMVRLQLVCADHVGDIHLSMVGSGGVMAGTHTDLFRLEMMLVFTLLYLAIASHITMI